MEPLKNPNKLTASGNIEARIDSQLKRFFSEREQFINTVRFQENEFKKLRKEIRANSPAWWKGFAIGALVMAGLMGGIIVLLF